MGRTGRVVVALFAAAAANNLRAQLIKHLPVYEAQDRMLYAKVKMADGAALPGFPEIEAICGGVAYPLGFTDTQGNFRRVLDSGGPRFNAGSNAEGAALDLSFLGDCAFRANAPGFRSQRISPRWMREMKDANTVSVGTITLSQPGEGQRDAPADAAVAKPAREAYKKAGAALADRKWQEAKSDFERATAAQPDYFAAWIGAGLADEALEQWQEAEQAYQKALELRPKSSEPYLRIARLEAKTGHWERAALYSESALSLDPHYLVEGYSLCALGNAKLGRMETAASSARAGLKLEGANEYPELLLSLALAQAAAKHYAEAAASLQNYLRLVPRAEGVPEIKQELAGLQTLLSK